MYRLIGGIVIVLLGVLCLIGVSHNPKGPTGHIIEGVIIDVVLFLFGGGLLIVFGARSLKKGGAVRLAKLYPLSDSKVHPPLKQKPVSIPRKTQVVKSKEKASTYLIRTFVLLFWLLGIMLTFEVFIKKDNNGLIPYWVVTLMFTIVVILRVRNIKRRTGRFNRESVVTLTLCASLIGCSIIVTPIILIYQWSCSKHLAPNTELCNCDYANKNLSHRDLHGSNFKEAVFVKANLEGTNLENAILTSANLSKSNLTDANLKSAILDSANLVEAVGLSDSILCDVLKVSKTALSTYLSLKQIRLESNEHLGNGLKAVCANRGEDEAAYQQDSSFHPMAYYQLRDSSYSYVNKLPKNFQPMAIRFCELVCIVEEKKQLIQTCNYTPHGTVERYQYQVHAVIRSARKAELISDTMFYGQEPSDCPKNISTSFLTYVGKAVDNKDIIQWLKKFVNPPK